MTRFSKRHNEVLGIISPEMRTARRRLVGAMVLVLIMAVIIPIILDPKLKYLPQDIEIRIPSRDKKNLSIGYQEELTTTLSTNNIKTHTLPRKLGVIDKRFSVSSEDSKKILLSSSTSTGSSARFLKKLQIDPELSIENTPIIDTLSVSEQRNVMGLVTTTKKNNSNTLVADKRPFVLQIAALESKDKVDRLQYRLKKIGINSYTQKIPTKVGNRIRIRVGGFRNKENAQRMRKRLLEFGLDEIFIVK